MSDFVLGELRGRFASAPDVPPPEMLGAVRAEAPALRERHRARLRRRAGVGVAIVAVLTAASFTPPGRAATGWVAEVAGIGESPTLPQVGSVPGSAVVVDSGTVSDGGPYELVARRVTLETLFPGLRHDAARAGALRSAPGPISRFGERFPEGICFAVEWPGKERTGGGGACAEAARPESEGKFPLESSGLWRPPGSSAEGTPAIFLGLLGDPAVRGVQVVRRDEDGSTTEIPVKLITLSGALLAQVGGKEPVRVFISRLDSSEVGGGIDGSATIEAIALDHNGDELGRVNPFPSPDCAESGQTRARSRERPSGGPRTATAAALPGTQRCGPIDWMP